MTMTKTRTDWTNRFAARTRSGGGEALTAILALSGRTDIISFSGGLPDPATLPGEALVDVMQTVLAGHDASALQYSPVKGLPGPLSYIAERLEALEHHRPAPDELLVTSGCIEALELLGRRCSTAATLPWWRLPLTWAPPWGSRASRPRSSR
jgi:2-aminoadipate transaminase